MKRGKKKVRLTCKCRTVRRWGVPDACSSPSIHRAASECEVGEQGSVHKSCVSGAGCGGDVLPQGVDSRQNSLRGEVMSSVCLCACSL